MKQKLLQLTFCILAITMTMMVACSNEDVPVEEEIEGATLLNLEGTWDCIQTTNTDWVPNGFKMTIDKSGNGYIVSKTNRKSSLFKPGVHIMQVGGNIKIAGYSFIYTEIPPNRFRLTKDAFKYTFKKTR